MVRIGIVGIGFMGMIHFLAAKKLRGAEVVAICSRDKAKREGDWRSIRGNFGPPGEIMDLSGIKKFERLEDMLADPEIDLIDICTPTDSHTDAAIHALIWWKHVLIEKPLSLKVGDAKAIEVTAEAHERLWMVAHVLPFFPDFAFAAELLKRQTYGKLLAGHFRRLISRPDWSADIGDAAKTGGPAIDLHIHDTHFIRMNFGMPVGVSSVGRVEDGVVHHLTTSYQYPNGPAITCTCGAITMKGRPFVHGYELFFENATVIYESGAIPLTVYHADGRIEQPTIGGAGPLDCFTAELQAAVDGLVSGKVPPELDPHIARDALAICYAECESAMNGGRMVYLGELGASATGV